MMNLRLFPMCELSGCGWGNSAIRVGKKKLFYHLTSVQNYTYGELAGSALDIEQLGSALSSASCQIFKLSLQIPLQLSPSKPLHECLIGSSSEKITLDLNGGVSLCYRGSESKLIWRAGANSLWCVSIEGVLCPSVCSFIDKLHWLVWQKHLCYRMRCTEQGGIDIWVLPHFAFSVS